MVNLNSNFNNPQIRRSSASKSGFSRRNSPVENRTSSPEISATDKKDIKPLSRAVTPAAPAINKFFQEFDKAQSNEALVKLFADLSDQLNQRPLNPSGKNNSPAGEFYNYLKSNEGSTALERKISKNIKGELEGIDIDNANLMDCLIPHQLISNFEENIALAYF